MLNKRTPCFYFPSTVVLVDDNHKYLHSLQLELDYHKASYKSFEDPIKALQFLEENSQANTLIGRCIKEDLWHDQRIFNVDIRAIHHEIYNPKRFTEVGAIIIDYAMPRMNGLELCQKRKNAISRRILLTGESQEFQAIRGFNNGDIHHYIRKDAANFSQVMNESVTYQLWEYFLMQSSMVSHSLTVQSQLSILNDLAFIKLFNEILEKTQCVEFYLLDKQGSFLFLDQKAKPTWLLIKSNHEVEKHYDYAREEGAENHVINALKQRQIIPYFHNDTDMQTHPTGWQPYLFPATPLDDTKTHFYSLITDSSRLKLEADKILSYEDYLKTL